MVISLRIPLNPKWNPFQFRWTAKMSRGLPVRLVLGSSRIRTAQSIESTVGYPAAERWHHDFSLEKKTTMAHGWAYASPMSEFVMSGLVGRLANGLHPPATCMADMFLGCCWLLLLLDRFAREFGCRESPRFLALNF
eukprot:s105_g25.t1